MEDPHEKLQVQEAQRNQVYIMHMADPDDSDVKELLNDLDEAIALTKSMIELQKEQIKQDVEQIRIEDEYSLDFIQPGDLCQGIYQNEWYTGKLRETMEVDGKTVYVVEFLGYPDIIGKLSKEKIRTYRPADPKSFKIGDSCLAVWLKDNKYYNATIDQIKDKALVVKFTSYGNYQETPMEYIHAYLYDKDGKRVGSKKLKREASAKKEEKGNQDKQKSWQDFVAKQKIGSAVIKRQRDQIETGKFVPVKKNKE